MNQENAIEVRNMSKRFKIEYDKSRTLKERLIRRKGKVEYNEVLKNINLDIKKGECAARQMPNLIWCQWIREINFVEVDDQDHFS